MAQQVFFGSTALAATTFTTRENPQDKHQTDTVTHKQRGNRKREAARFFIEKKTKTTVEPKVWIPLSCNTVIKRYIPFMEKRGVFKTYKVDVT